MPGRCYIAGLGPGNPEHIPLALWQLLEQGSRLLYLRTAYHPAVKALEERGIKFTSFDPLYETAASFEELYREIVRTLLRAAKSQEVIYAVPGHPLVAEVSVSLLLKEAGAQGIETPLIPALSCLDAVFVALKLDPTSGLFILDALAWPGRPWNLGQGALITQVYNRRVAGEVKLKLMDFLPDEHPVVVVRAAGVPGEERIREIPLYKLDRITWLDHLTTLYVTPYPEGDKYTLEGLRDLMARLRGPEGCPWDKQQTHQTLKRYLLEETYEVLEALEEGDMHKLSEELGDLLLQVVFHARLAEEEGFFNLRDVVVGIVDKMIRRHPHVFGQAKLKTAQQVLKRWEEIKALERKDNGEEALLQAPRILPALLRALKVQEQAARVGFDWPEVKEVWAKVYEELEELKASVNIGEEEKITEEVGDVLFALVNLARWLKVEPETALTKTIDKFCRRFHYIAEEARRQGRKLETMTLEEMDTLWEKAKN
ncbi:tetrapyrrole methylase family protein / MazG family protein [Thermanaeromonas toyohensis ToBE]|uniref:Tetrapyrrole methylase family protein / MazG family protein n=1 Tax=Thermanaeromonas toyohensis ToBE TaxID=698762 RepID=A0A1W1V8U9_9FIRM|nr:nucleoside triphosphate pyrophosphohydrolase [Thermanaeromonas toyohensis]SMB89481.1 tetrapyrrole methylase family protein / MazG family protein [Thermanaeromonas toyohensis ToBE]